MNVQELARQNLDLSQAPHNGIKELDKEIAKIVGASEKLLNGAGEVERTYIQKNPQDRDGYDVAFGRLNPESAEKARKYQQLMNRKLELENEKVNLESAKNFFNDLYAQQRNEVNRGYDNLQQGNAVSNDIATASALATAGGLGANGMQSAGLKAQAANILAAQQLQAEAQRQKDLASVSQQEAQTPLMLSQMGQINASINSAAGGGGSSGVGGYSGGGSYVSRRGPDYNPPRSDNKAESLPDGVIKTDDGKYLINGVLYNEDTYNTFKDSGKLDQLLGSNAASDSNVPSDSSVSSDSNITSNNDSSSASVNALANEPRKSRGYYFDIKTNKGTMITASSYEALQKEADKRGLGLVKYRRDKGQEKDVDAYTLIPKNVEDVWRLSPDGLTSDQKKAILKANSEVSFRDARSLEGYPKYARIRKKAEDKAKQQAAQSVIDKLQSF